MGVEYSIKGEVEHRWTHDSDWAFDDKEGNDVAPASSDDHVIYFVNTGALMEKCAA